jgi:hypothetical protein
MCHLYIYRFVFKLECSLLREKNGQIALKNLQNKIIDQLRAIVSFTAVNPSTNILEYHPHLFKIKILSGKYIGYFFI